VGVDEDERRRAPEPAPTRGEGGGAGAVLGGEAGDDAVGRRSSGRPLMRSIPSPSSVVAAAAAAARVAAVETGGMGR
jgi:hypothetical protein